MTPCETLKTLITEQVLLDIEEAIDEIYTQIAESKNATEQQQAQTAELQEMRKEFQALVAEIEAGELDGDECQEIIAEIKEMMEES